MTRSPRSPRTTSTLRRRRRALAGAAAFLLVPLAASCGTTGSDDSVLGQGKGTTVTTAQPTPTTTAPVDEPDPQAPCDPDLTEGTSGAAARPGCSVDPTPDPDPVPDPDPMPCGLTRGAAARPGCSIEPMPDPDPAPDPDPGPAPDPEPEGDEVDYVAALSRGLMAGDSVDDVEMTATEAACVAPIWIDILDADELAANGISPDDLADLDLMDDLSQLIDRSQADAMVAAFDDCDYDLLDSLRTSMDPAEADCIFDELPEGTIEKLLAEYLDQGDEISESSPTVEAVADAMAACGSY